MQHSERYVVERRYAFLAWDGFQQSFNALPHLGVFDKYRYLSKLVVDAAIVLIVQ